MTVLTTLRPEAVLNHDTRVRLLCLASANRNLSPIAASKQLNEPLGTISYHMKWLVEHDLLKLGGERQRRGAVRHFYAINERYPEWPRILADAQQRIRSLESLKAFATDIEPLID